MKLILIVIAVFIGTDVIAKSSMVILFLVINVTLRVLDPPFLTNRLNRLDLNSSISLLIIYYSLFLASTFDDDALNIFVLLVIILTNFQFMIGVCRTLLLYTLFKISSNPKLEKIHNHIQRFFAGIQHFF